MPRKRTFTIEAALDGAMEVFSERGYHGTSMEALATHLKLSRSSIYATFGDKAALFVKALRRNTGAGRALGLSELGGAGSPRGALVRVFEMAAGSGGERPPRALKLLIEATLGLHQLHQLQHREAEIARLVEETFLDMERSFRTAIERGQAAAEIAAEVDAMTVARVLLGLYIGWYVAAGCGTAGEPVQRAVLEQVQTLLPAP